MIVYVDLEHRRVRQDPKRYDAVLARRLETKYRLEELTGDLCLIVRYERVCPPLLDELRARAVLVSGCDTDFEHYDDGELAGLRAIYRAAALPILGFCAGHQLMAQAYGASLGPMGALPPGAPDPNPESQWVGMKREHGFMPVRITRPNPLFDGLGESAELFQAHYWEVRSVPEGFQPLAESPLCALQAMAHERLPLYGTQFHPEEYDDAHPAGRRVLENFFRATDVVQ